MRSRPSRGAYTDERPRYPSFEKIQEPQTSPVSFTNTSAVNQQVPVLSHYELRTISPLSGDQTEAISDRDTVGGNEEYGLFATQNIKEGTRIICEAPLFTLSASSLGNQIKAVRAAYDRLAYSDQERIWDLKPSSQEASEELMVLGATVRPVVITIGAILCKLEENRTKEERQELKSDGWKLGDTLETLRLYARWIPNHQSLINLPESERHGLPPEAPVSGLFIEASKLRHSCVPNCYVSYNSTTKRMAVHVLRDIEPGEELTASAITDTMYYDTADARKQRLFEQFGIKCACEACDSSHPSFKMHQTAREMAYARVVMVADFCTRLETVEFESVQADLHLPIPPSATDRASLQELIDAEDAALALCENLRATKCNNIEQIRWRNALIDRIQPKLAEFQTDAGRMKIWKAMAAHAKVCEIVGRRCFGEDHDEFKRLSVRKENIIAALQRAKEHVNSKDKKEEAVSLDKMDPEQKLRYVMMSCS